MRLIITLIFAVIFNLGFSQIIIPKKDYNPEPTLPRIQFGVSLAATSNSLTSYAIVKEFYDGHTEVIHLTFQSFIRQISGNEESRANPEKINYLDQYNVTVSDFQELWKLKHDRYPYGHNNEKGYGTSSGIPSKSQFGLLKTYGITNIDDFCFGDNLWRLMKETQRIDWLNVYGNAK